MVLFCDTEVEVSEPEGVTDPERVPYTTKTCIFIREINKPRLK